MNFTDEPKGVIPEGGHDDTDAIAEDTFHRWLPETPEAYSHDADGNLEFDARWGYTWNGENRLEAMETRPTAYQAGAPRERLEFVYDSQGRRVLKVHLEWDDTEETFVETRRDRFVYHGWNLLLQVTERPDLDTAYVSQRFVWGIDLSGDMRGAGGVGGLLMVRFSGNVTAYLAYDGNGNVMGLFDPVDGEWAAEYEYGAFGEPLRSTGPLADRNRFRFSTKYTDSATGLLYYGFRYYNPANGRWLNRDPIEERGGLNQHAFVLNRSLNAIDYQGLMTWRTYNHPGRLSKWAAEVYRGDPPPDPPIFNNPNYECTEWMNYPENNVIDIRRFTIFDINPAMDWNLLAAVVVPSPKAVINYRVGMRVIFERPFTYNLRRTYLIMFGWLAICNPCDENRIPEGTEKIFRHTQELVDVEYSHLAGTEYKQESVSFEKGPSRRLE